MKRTPRCVLALLLATLLAPGARGNAAFLQDLSEANNFVDTIGSDSFIDPTTVGNVFDPRFTNTLINIGNNISIKDNISIIDNNSIGGTGTIKFDNINLTKNLQLSLLGDPVITGFDGKPFHHDDAGDFNLLEDGVGWKVDATFEGATVKGEGGEDNRVSWTREIRVFSPNGDMVSCSLASVRTDALTVQMTGVAATDGSETVLSPAGQRAIQYGELRAEAVLSEEGEQPTIRACRIYTPTLSITVSQIFGKEQAAKFPETEAWAAPFIWLDLAVDVLGLLPPPVTGLMSAGYPEYADAAAAADAATSTQRANQAQQAALRPDSDAQAKPATLAVEGKVHPPAGRGTGSRRLMAGRDATDAPATPDAPFKPARLGVAPLLSFLL